MGWHPSEIQLKDRFVSGETTIRRPNSQQSPAGLALAVDQHCFMAHAQSRFISIASPKLQFSCD